MAHRAAAYSDNVPGDWFVDERCIDCDVCRQLAGNTFAAAADHSFVSHQPTSPGEQRDALRALLSCPTGAIGSADLTDLAVVRAGFPEPIVDDVFYNGFTSERSFGSHSYFIRHPDGNWLVDSPRYLEPLAKRFDALGGIQFFSATATTSRTQRNMPRGSTPVASFTAANWRRSLMQRSSSTASTISALETSSP